MNIAEKLIKIAENEQKVYNAGYEKGKSEGGDTTAAYNQGYTEGYNAAEVSNPFYYATRIDNTMGGATFPENYELVMRLQKAPQYFGYVLNNVSNLKSARFISDVKRTEEEGGINISNILNVGTVTPTLEWADFSEFETKFITIYMAFRNQSILKTIIGAFDLTNCTNTSNAFYYCQALEDIEFVPNTIKISIDFHWCTKLTKASITSIINGLSADTSGLTVTLSKTAINNAFGGTESAEWLALIAPKSNWTISLV